MTAPALTGVRPSAAAICPRWAAYQGTGRADPAPADPDHEGYAERGRQLEDVVAARLKREGRRFRRQVSIPWPRKDPYAIGHADFILTTERTLVEVHSNTGAKLYHHKALQAAMYASGRKGIREAYVVAIDPSDLRERWWPIDVAAMRPRVDAIADAIRTSLEGGPLPARTCRHPNDSPGRFCPFRYPCFADWVWPEP